jgi:hypothetical protein
MKIELVMKDRHGVHAMLVVEGEWIALNPEDVEAVKTFGPMGLGRITQYYDNGSTYVYPVYGKPE